MKHRVEYSRLFFSAAPKKNSRRKNSRIQKLKQKNSNSSLNRHFSAFLQKKIEGNYIFSLKYVPKISKLTIFITNSRPKTKNSRIYLKTQAKKLNFWHFQNRWISAKCTKIKPELKCNVVKVQGGDNGVHQVLLGHGCMVVLIGFDTNWKVSCD